MWRAGTLSTDARNKITKNSTGSFDFAPEGRFAQDDL
jgi:hypothetical protein